MTIEFFCACGKKLGVADTHAGKRVKCPVCLEPVTVPEPQAHPVPELSAEDAAFQALMAAPDPEPAKPTAVRPTRPESAGERPPAPPPPPYRGHAPSERTLSGFDAPEPPQARREKRRPRRDHPEYDDERRPWIALSPGLLGGIAGMLVGGGLLLVGLLAGRIIIWSVVIFALGFIATVKGVLGYSED